MTNKIAIDNGFFLIKERDIWGITLFVLIRTNNFCGEYLMDEIVNNTGFWLSHKPYEYISDSSIKFIEKYSRKYKGNISFV